MTVSRRGLECATGGRENSSREKGRVRIACGDRPVEAEKAEEWR